MKTFKAAVIGAGFIGAQADIGKKKWVISHGHAYKLSPRTVLTSFCDTNPVNLKKACAAWGGKGYTNLKTLLNAEQPEVVSVCVPDKQHKEVLLNILKYGRGVRAIFCEKPLTLSSESTQAIIAQFVRRKIKFAINFTRRFDADLSDVRDSIYAGAWGQLINGQFIYSKGIKHNGCHAVDLIQFFFGRIKRANFLTAFESAVAGDPAIDALIFTRAGSVHLLGGSFSRYSIFDCRLWFEKAQLSISQTLNMIELSSSKAHPLYRGRFILKTEWRKKNCFRSAIQIGIQQLIKSIGTRQQVGASAIEIIENQRLTEKLAALGLQHLKKYA